MIEYEQSLWDQGYAGVAGIDEVGRGCLFGDVVAAAVILPQGRRFPEFNDSKMLTEARREACFDEILRFAVAVGIGRVDVMTIDRINIRQAARLAMKQALAHLRQVPDCLLIDAESVETSIPQQAIIKGDQRSQSIAAASIVAKVTRDRLCLQWDLLYPEYGLARHKGYATKQHRDALLEYGPTPMHRQSFLGNVMAVQQTLF